MRFVAKWKGAVKANFARRFPAARMQPNWDLLAEITASAVIGAYTWWMEHPQAAGTDEAKRQIERAIDAIVASI